jgi:hypothetical protein
MNYLLLDTCIWLNLADWRESEVLAAIGELLAKKVITIILPDIVQTEFTRNEDDTLSKREKAAKSHIKQVRTWVELLESEEEQNHLKKLLEQLNSQAGKRTQIAMKSTEVVRSLMKQCVSSATTEKIRDAAFQCCLQKTAPCHRGKNNLADAVILEHFKAIDVSSPENKRFFVTDNSEDFGGTDRRKPYETLQPFFDEKFTHYRTNIAELLNEISPGIVSPKIVENVARLQEAMRQLRTVICKHEFDEKQGAWLRSQYGGLTWQLRCKHCGALFDTGEPYDE